MDGINFPRWTLHTLTPTIFKGKGFRSFEKHQAFDLS